MKVKVYVRVGRKEDGKAKVSVGTRPNYKALETDGWNGKVLPTVAFAMDLNIPDASFDAAEKVLAEIEVPEDAVVIAAEVGSDA